MDRRWQFVLDCLDVEHAPFSKGTLVTFRQRCRSPPVHGPAGQRRHWQQHAQVIRQRVKTDR